MNKRSKKGKISISKEKRSSSQEKIHLKKNNQRYYDGRCDNKGRLQVKVGQYCVDITDH